MYNDVVEGVGVGVWVDIAYAREKEREGICIISSGLCFLRDFPLSRSLPNQSKILCISGAEDEE